jgi:hypothetical protein
MQIQWHGALFDCGTKCGIVGEMGEGRAACRLGYVDELTADHVLDAAAKIEFAIRLQLEAAEKKAKADQTPA